MLMLWYPMPITYFLTVAVDLGIPGLGLYGTLLSCFAFTALEDVPGG